VFPLKDNIPTERFPIVTVALILANVLMFFFFQKAKLSFGGSGVSDINTVHYGVIPYELTHPGKHCDLVPNVQAIVCQPTDIPIGHQPPTWLTVFTSMFMHGGLLHLGGNMLFLWIFGNNVEDAMGRLRFILFYLLGGVAAIAFQTLVEPNAAIPTIGASGAVAAVLGAYIVLYPRARVLTLVFIILFFTVIELPAVLMIGVWFVQQVLFGAYGVANPTGGGGGVAYFAHIGGFIFGALTIRAFARRERLGPPRVPVYY
jgi:membrane associated rhomboid family serine protease